LLIIVCGSEGIHKKFLARKVIAAVNNFKVKNYSIDFNCYPFKVYDKNNNLVYQNTSRLSQKYSYSDKILFDENDLDPTVYGKGINLLDNSISKQILQLENDLFLGGLKYYRDIFANSALDYELFTPDVTTDFTDDNVELATAYIDLITSYRNSTLENFVVCGSFGKTYLQKIADEIGQENLKVLNITRNPSVSWCVHQKPDKYYELNKSQKLEGKQGDREKYLETTLASISIRELDFVDNLKFEDIIQTGLTVLGKEVTLPLGYNSFNQWLTEYEITHLIPEGYANDSVIQEMNNTISAFLMTDNFDIDLDLPSNANDYFPNDFFKIQQYVPLNYRQIVDKR